MGIKNTYLTQNNMCYLFFSIYETERTLLIFGTHNTCDTLSTSLESNENDTILDPHITCLTPTPSSTHKSKLVSVKVSNNSLSPVIWKYALLSTNQVPLLEIVFEREKNNKIPFWNMSATSSTSIVDPCYLVPISL
jgi:hypothetical protein